ncbi:MAG: DUF1735 domain-containing protein [Mariniphaga sp.]|nr:DUF1735 domain-containing protein [Mariniphaga sp.]
MKRNIFYLFMITAFTSLILTSCEDNIEGTLFDVGDGVHAAFASNVQLVDMIPEDGNEIKVPVYRGGNSSSEATVSIEMIPAESIPSGLFTLTNPQLTFPVGENVAYAVISYQDINDLAAGEVYEITLKLTNEEQISVSESDEITVKAQRKLTFTKLGNATFESEFFEEAWEVEVYKAAEADVYRIMDAYYNGFHITFSVASDNTISFSAQPMGYVHPDYGMTSFTMPREEYDQPYRDGKVINLFAEFRVAAGSFGLFQEVLILP